MKYNLDDIYSIELDLKIFGSAKILIKDKNNYTLDTIEPRWSEKYNVYNFLIKRWFEGIQQKSI